MASDLNLFRSYLEYEVTIESVTPVSSTEHLLAHFDKCITFLPSSNAADASPLINLQHLLFDTLSLCSKNNDSNSQSNESELVALLLYSTCKFQIQCDITQQEHDATIAQSKADTKLVSTSSFPPPNVFVPKTLQILQNLLSEKDIQSSHSSQTLSNSTTKSSNVTSFSPPLCRFFLKIVKWSLFKPLFKAITATHLTHTIESWKNLLPPNLFVLQVLQKLIEWIIRLPLNSARTILPDFSRLLLSVFQYSNIVQSEKFESMIIQFLQAAPQIGKHPDTASNSVNVLYWLLSSLLSIFSFNLRQKLYQHTVLVLQHATCLSLPLLEWVQQLLLHLNRQSAQLSLNAPIRTNDNSNHTNEAVTPMKIHLQLASHLCLLVDQTDRGEILRKALQTLNLLTTQLIQWNAKQGIREASLVLNISNSTSHDDESQGDVDSFEAARIILQKCMTCFHKYCREDTVTKGMLHLHDKNTTLSKNVLSSGGPLWTYLQTLIQSCTVAPIQYLEVMFPYLEQMIPFPMASTCAYRIDVLRLFLEVFHLNCMTRFWKPSPTDDQPYLKYSAPHGGSCLQWYSAFIATRYPLFKNIVYSLLDSCRISFDANHPDSHRKKQCLRAVVALFGPEVLLSFFPLRILDVPLRDTQYTEKSNSWILPVLRASVHNSRALFFSSDILPLINSCYMKSHASLANQAYEEATIYRELGQQLWTLLPSFFSEPLDLAEAFEYKEGLLVNAMLSMIEDDVVRPHICRALVVLCRNLKSKNPSFVMKATASNNERVLKKYSDLIIGTLIIKFLKTNSSTTKISDSTAIRPSKLHLGLSLSLSDAFLKSQSLIEAIKEYCPYCRVELLQKNVDDFFDALVKTVEGTRSNLNAVECASLVDLIDALATRLPEVHIKEVLKSLAYLMMVCLDQLKSTPSKYNELQRNLPKQHNELVYIVLRKCYKCIKHILQLQLDDCKHITLITTPEDLVNFWNILNNFSDLAGSACLKSRISCVTAFVRIANKIYKEHKSFFVEMHAFLGQIVPEVLLNLTEVNKCVRQRAKYLLDALCEVMTPTIDDLIVMIIAGLSGPSTSDNINPLKPAAVVALTHLFHFHGDRISDLLKEEAMSLCFYLLEDPNKSVFTAALKFSKTAISRMTKSQVKDSLSRFFKILDSTLFQDSRMLARLVFFKLIRVMGPGFLKQCTPAKHLKYICYIERQFRRQLSNKTKSVAESDRVALKAGCSTKNEAVAASESSDDEREMEDYESLKSALLKYAPDLQHASQNESRKQRTEHFKVEESGFPIVGKDGKILIQDTSISEADQDSQCELGTTTPIMTMPASQSKPSVRAHVTNAKKVQKPSCAIKVGRKRGHIIQRHGSEYRSTKAGGDVRKAGQSLKPYAYLRLNPKMSRAKHRDRAINSLKLFLDSGPKNTTRGGRKGKLRKRH